MPIRRHRRFKAPARQAFVPHREGAKIVPPQASSAAPDWRDWLVPGGLVVLKKGVCLLRNRGWDGHGDWNGKQALHSEDVHWVQPGSASVVAWPGTVALYVGEIGRRTVGNTREGVHFFLLPSGPYVVPLNCWDPMPGTLEESSSSGV
jgi:hypothetical protein